MRYTHKNKFFGYIMQKINPVGDVVIQEIQFGDKYDNPYTTTTSYVGTTIDKLGQLEDVMQKFGIESVEELEKIIHCNTTNALIEMGNKSMLELQNEQLKHLLAVKDKALELACGSIWEQTPPYCKFNEECLNFSNDFQSEFSNNIGCKKCLTEYFIEEAKKELKESSYETSNM